MDLQTSMVASVFLGKHLIVSPLYCLAFAHPGYCAWGDKALATWRQSSCWCRRGNSALAGSAGTLFHSPPAGLQHVVQHEQIEPTMPLSGWEAMGFPSVK